VLVSLFFSCDIHSFSRASGVTHTIIFLLWRLPHPTFQPDVTYAVGHICSRVRNFTYVVL
jgi:hypothetical protein